MIDRALDGSRLAQTGHSGEPLDLADDGEIGDLQRHGEALGVEINIVNIGKPPGHRKSEAGRSHHAGYCDDFTL
ncbi:hypothetical protein [Thiocapsa sp.]|uniref:hypothetical protein n=1 Tax=Thiocapsa sp. TaxID=2024551 RepID=UPI0035936894